MGIENSARDRQHAGPSGKTNPNLKEPPTRGPFGGGKAVASACCPEPEQPRRGLFARLVNTGVDAFDRKPKLTPEQKAQLRAEHLHIVALADQLAGVAKDRGDPGLADTYNTCGEGSRKTIRRSERE